MALKKFGYKSIKGRFVSYTIQIIIICPIVAILLTMILVNFMNLDGVRPANYYEKKLPEIREVVNAYQGDKALLNEKLNEVILKEEMAYKIVDTDGQVLYEGGNSKKIPVEWLKTERMEEEQKSYIGWMQPYGLRYIPLKQQDMYSGGVIIGYWLINTSDIPVLKQVVPYINVIITSVPFITVIVVLLIYARKFFKAIERPLNVLQEGILKIQENDLDFKMQSPSQDEIGRMCASFEKMRSALQASLEENWQKEEERKKLISSLAHDLRTPLTVIKGHTELLLEEDMESNHSKESVLAIQKNANRLTRLVEALNQINKWQQVELISENEQVNLEVFLNEKIGDYQILAQKKKIRIDTKMDNVSQEVSLPVEMWSQILDNLVSNSLRFTPEGGIILLKVKLEARSEDNQFTLCVEDSGCGFKEEDLKEACTLFYQGDKSRNSGQHYGIGLYTVDYLVKKMGGVVSLYQSSLGGAGIKIIVLTNS